MKYIILDTNQIFNDFYMNSITLKKLFILGEYAEIEICIPEFVVEEVIKKYMDTVSPTIKKINECIYENNKLKIFDKFIDKKISKSEIKNNYRKTLKSILTYHNIRIIGYPQNKDSVKMISERYFFKKKPFDENKISFQDAIIWYSIKEFIDNYLDQEDILYFLTNNSKDFFAPKVDNHIELHKDFKEDLKNKNQIIVLKTVQDLLSVFEEDLNYILEDKSNENKKLLIEDFLENLNSYSSIDYYFNLDNYIYEEIEENLNTIFSSEGMRGKYFDYTEVSEISSNINIKDKDYTIFRDNEVYLSMKLDLDIIYTKVYMDIFDDRDENCLKIPNNKASLEIEISAEVTINEDINENAYLDSYIYDFEKDLTIGSIHIDNISFYRKNDFYMEE